MCLCSLETLNNYYLLCCIQTIEKQVHIHHLKSKSVLVTLAANHNMDLSSLFPQRATLDFQKGSKLNFVSIDILRKDAAGDEVPALVYSSAEIATVTGG
jgi:hypothetical protein